MLATFDRQRRNTTHDFIQAQTIRNMAYLSGGEREEHEKRKAEMQRIRNDDGERRKYLLRQSMIECLELEGAQP